MVSRIGDVLTLNSDLRPSNANSSGTVGVASVLSAAFERSIWSTRNYFRGSSYSGSHYDTDCVIIGCLVSNDSLIGTCGYVDAYINKTCEIHDYTVSCNRDIFRYTHSDSQLQHSLAADFIDVYIFIAWRHYGRMDLGRPRAHWFYYLRTSYNARVNHKTLTTPY